MSEDKAKREILRDKVVDLVKEFIKTEGEITLSDLESLFGSISPVTGYQVAAAIAKMPVLI